MCWPCRLPRCLQVVQQPSARRLSRANRRPARCGWSSSGRTRGQGSTPSRTEGNCPSCAQVWLGLGCQQTVAEHDLTCPLALECCHATNRRVVRVHQRTTLIQLCSLLMGCSSYLGCFCPCLQGQSWTLCCAAPCGTELALCLASQDVLPAPTINACTAPARRCQGVQHDAVHVCRAHASSHPPRHAVLHGPHGGLEQQPGRVSHVGHTHTHDHTVVWSQSCSLPDQQGHKGSTRVTAKPCRHLYDFTS